MLSVVAPLHLGVFTTLYVIVLLLAVRYQQVVGVAQGSITSTLLCSLYLAHLETTHLRPLLPTSGAPAAADGGGSVGAGELWGGSVGAGVGGGGAWA